MKIAQKQFYSTTILCNNKGVLVFWRWTKINWTLASVRLHLLWHNIYKYSVFKFDYLQGGTNLNFGYVLQFCFSRVQRSYVFSRVEELSIQISDHTWVSIITSIIIMLFFISLFIWYLPCSQSYSSWKHLWHVALLHKICN